MPRPAPPGGPWQVTTVRLPAEMLAEVDGLATRAGVERSEMLRRLIAAGIGSAPVGRKRKAKDRG